MANPEILKYHESHSWLNVEHADVCSVGVTRHAQEQLGDIVFVPLPVVGATVKQGEPCMAIESTKTLADVHAPASGVVTEVNAVLADTPELVNNDPYSTLLFRMKLGDPAELELLLGVTDYRKRSCCLSSAIRNMSGWRLRKFCTNTARFWCGPSSSCHPSC